MVIKRFLVLNKVADFVINMAGVHGVNVTPLTNLH